MSLEIVRDMVSALPRLLGEQVIGYAESVERSLPDICREAGKKRSKDLSVRVTFLAGLKKIHSLAASSFWTLDNSGKLLAEMDVSSIRIGGRDASRGGEVYRLLQSLVNDLEKTLSKSDVYHYLSLSWVDTVKELASDGHQRD